MGAVFEDWSFCRYTHHHPTFIFLDNLFQTLLAIEEAMGEPIYPYFDWVAGTSTGALVAVSLAQGKNKKKKKKLFLFSKCIIFIYDFFF